MPEPDFRVLGLVGSLRKDSWNRRLLDAARELAPEGMQIAEGSLADLPFYNQDLEQAEGPPAVAVFKSALQAADAVLIATPEYNYSIPGVLKNALDWASRPAGKSVLSEKPILLMGASPGLMGTVRAQIHLRQVLLACNALVMQGPEILVGQAPQKFDPAGRLADEPTRTFIARRLVAFRDWAARWHR